MSRRKVIGIYKIISPSGRVYVGQSIDVYRRFQSYKNLGCKEQPILYRSFLKYGVDNHFFDIIEECPLSKLDERERYWQETMECIHPKKGMNCVLQQTGLKKRVITKDVSDKLSKGNKGKVVSDETRYKMSIAKKDIKGLDHNNAVRVIARNLKTKEIIIDSMLNMAQRLGVDRELVFNRCNFIQTSYRKLFDWDIDYLDKKVDKQLNLGQNIPILDVDTGVFYYGKKDLKIHTGVSGCLLDKSSRYIR